MSQSSSAVLGLKPENVKGPSGLKCFFFAQLKISKYPLGEIETCSKKVAQLDSERCFLSKNIEFMRKKCTEQNAPYFE